MFQSNSLRNKQVIGSQSPKNVGIEFNSLLLGMMTAFKLELKEKQIYQNIRTLFKELNLPKVKGLASIVRHNLAFLQSNGLVIHHEGGYIVSEKGEPLGMHALMQFRQYFTN